MPTHTNTQRQRSHSKIIVSCVRDKEAKTSVKNENEMYLNAKNNGFLELKKKQKKTKYKSNVHISKRVKGKVFERPIVLPIHSLLLEDEEK